MRRLRCLLWLAALALLIIELAAVPTTRAATEGVTETQLKVAGIARQQVGKHYRRGATGPEAFDCSGLVLFAYHQAGVTADQFGQPLGRSSSDFARQGVATGCTLDDLAGTATTCWQPGDVAVYTGHVAIYVGDGQFADAQNRSTGVILNDPSSSAFYRQAWRGARRYLPTP